MVSRVERKELILNLEKLKDQVVVITGGSNGIGKATALALAKHGAKIALGDLDEKAALDTVARVRSLGSQAVFRRTDVTKYQDQVALFKLAEDSFGSVDVVFPNAGVTELSQITDILIDEKGLPREPNLKTIEINLNGVIFTTHLAYHYFKKNKKPAALKTVVVTASMSSFMRLPQAPLYTTSKHAVLGFTRSMAPRFQSEGMKIRAVCPYFVGTSMTKSMENERENRRVDLSKVPLVSLDTTAAVMLHAATDPERRSNGAAYAIITEKDIFAISALATNVTEVLSAMPKVRL